MPNNVIELVIKADDRASAQIRGITGRLDSMSRTLTGIGVASAGFGVAIAIGLRKVATATIHAQEAAAQLDAAYKATGGTVGLTRARLDELAVSLQRTTVFEDDLVRSAESVLLTFDKVRGDAFERTIKAAADLSARMGTDLVSAVRSIGIALQEPEEGLNRLRRAGIIFSESQKEIIKNLVESGRATEAQNFILTELEKRFGGAAEAARNTLGGALKGLKNAFSDLLELDSTQTAGLVSLINTLAENIGKLTSAVLIGASAWALYRGAMLSVGIATAVADFVKLFAAVATGRAVLISATAQNAALALSNQEAAVAALAAASAEVRRTQAMLAGTRATQARILANVEQVASEATRATVARNVAGAEAAAAAAMAAQAAAAAKVANGAKAATTATAALTVATSKLRGALALLGLTNPYVLAAVAIGGLIALIVKGQRDAEFASKARQLAIAAEIAQIKGFAGIQSDYQKKRLVELEAEKLKVDALREAYGRQREAEKLGFSLKGEPQRGRGVFDFAKTGLDPDVRRRLEEALSPVEKAKQKLIELQGIFANVRSRFAAGSEEMKLATNALTQAQKEYNEALKEASERPEIEPVLVTAKWDTTLRDWNDETKTALERNIDEWRAFNAKIRVLVSEGLSEAIAAARVKEKLDELIPEVKVTVAKIDTRPFEELTAAGKFAAEEIQRAFADAFRGIFEGDSFRSIARNFLRAFAEIPIQIMAEDFSARVRKTMEPKLAKMFGTIGGAAGSTGAAGPTAQERAAGIVQKIERDTAAKQAAQAAAQPVVAAVQKQTEATVQASTTMCECICNCLSALRSSLTGGPDAVVGAIGEQTKDSKTIAKTASNDVVTGIDTSIKTSTQAINNTAITVGNQITNAIAGGKGGGFLDAISTGLKLYEFSQGGGFAGGGRTPAGIFNVGEEGPERVMLPAGSRVMNQRQMAFAGGGAPQVNLYETHHITIEGASDADDTQRKMASYLVTRDAKLEQRIFERLKANGFGRMR